MTTTDGQRILKHLAQIRTRPDRGEELWRRVVEVDARKTAYARGRQQRRADGKPSRLVAALMGARSPDRRWYMGQRAPAGGEIRMSMWARRASKDAFTYSEKDRGRWLREIGRHVRRTR